MKAKGGKGKRAALLFAVPGTLCLAGAGWVFRASILEEWYLFRLSSSDARAREGAAEELAAMRSRRAIPRFIESLERAPGHLVPLIRIGPPAVAALLDSLGEDEKSQERRQKILRMLIDLGPGEKQELAPSLAGAWQECADETSQVVALKLMIQMRLDEEAVMPALKMALGSPSAEVRGTAALALAKISPDRAKGAVPALSDLLRDPDESVRSRAVSGLGRIGAPAAAALPGLIGALKDHSGEVRSMAALALARVGTGPASDGTVRALLAFLGESDGEGGDRLAAVQALGELGAAARAAESLLERMALKAEDLQFRAGAARALRRIRGEEERAAR